jgi:hypothetical protein
LLFGTKPFFSWLVRHHRSAQLSATEPIIKEIKLKWLVGVVVGGMTLFVAVLLDRSPSPAAFGLLGLVPGIASLAVTLCDVRAGTARKWLLAFSAALLVAGPILMVALRGFILELDPDPRSAALLAVPAILVVIVSHRIKQKDRVQQHQQTLAASRKRIFPE